MKVKMVIMHVQSGKCWVGEQSEVSEKDLEEVKTSIKENLSSLTYIDVDGDIIPGEFIRQHCVIKFQIE